VNLNKLKLIAITCCLVLASLWLTAAVITGNYFSVTIATLIGLTIGWVVIGAPVWWLAIPFSVAAGGVFYVGFKIYPYELAIAAAMLAIIPAATTNLGAILKHRERLPMPVLLLCGYLGLHWILSIAYNRYFGLGGSGNVTRSYGAALWVVIFIILFHLFGSTKQLRIALALIFLGNLVRLLTGLVANYTMQTFTIPIINYTPAGFMTIIEGAGAQDLRHSGLALCALSLAILPLCRTRVFQLVFVCLAALSLPVLLLGGGRGALVVWFFFPTLYCLLYRKIWSLLVFICLIIGIVGIINAEPRMLNGLPFYAQRAASILIVEEGISAAQEIGSRSNQFHERFTAEAYARWTQNLFTFLFGTGIRPAEKNFSLESDYGYGNFGLWLEAMVTNAANTGAYEKGIWTVLAVTGLAGLLLYLNVFRWLFWQVGKDLWRNKISTPGRALGFLGIVNTVVWLLLGWKLGSYPSYEIFCLYLAYQALMDSRGRAEPEDSESIYS